MVVDRQQQRLEEDRLGEGGLDDDQGGVGEVDLALRVAPDVPGEPVVGQPLQRRLVDDLFASLEVYLPLPEAEVTKRCQGPADTGDDAVPSAVGQPTREQLEHRS